MDQNNANARSLEKPSPMMRARASFHGNAGRSQLTDSREQLAARDLARQHHPVVVHPVQVEGQLAKIDSHKLERHASLRQLATHRGREAGGVHPITCAA